MQSRREASALVAMVAVKPGALGQMYYQVLGICRLFIGLGVLKRVLGKTVIWKGGQVSYILQRAGTGRAHRGQEVDVDCLLCPILRADVRSRLAYPKPA